MAFWPSMKRSPRPSRCADRPTVAATRAFAHRSAGTSSAAWRAARTPPRSLVANAVSVHRVRQIGRKVTESHKEKVDGSELVRLEGLAYRSGPSGRTTIVDAYG